MNTSVRTTKLLLWGVSVIWGLNVVMVKYLIGYFSPVSLAAFRISIAFVVLLAATVWNRQLVRVSGRNLFYIFAAGMTSIFLHQITLGFGMETTPASVSALILGLNPLTTLVLAALFFGERLTGRKAAGVIIGFAGVICVILGGENPVLPWWHVGRGEWIVCLAMLMYVIGGLFIKMAAREVPVLVITCYSHGIASVLLITAALAEPGSRALSRAAGPWAWGVLVFSACIATALASVAWNRGIQKIGASKTTMFLNALPASSLLFSIALLGEHFRVVDAIGIGAVAAGILIGTSTDKAAPPETNMHQNIRISQVP